MPKAGSETYRTSDLVNSLGGWQHSQVQTVSGGQWVICLPKAGWLTCTFPRQKRASSVLWLEQSKEAFLFPVLLALSLPSSCPSQVDADPKSRFARLQDATGLGRERDQALSP